MNNEQKDADLLYLLVVAILFILLILMLTSCSPDNLPTFTSMGRNTVMSMTVANNIQCPTGGTVVSYGLDTNNNNVLDANEVQGQTIICNGSVGATGGVGNTGPSGSPGIGVVFTSVPATTLQCANGGTLLLLASDTLNTGVYSTLDSNQMVITTCNGINGRDAPVPQYGIAKPIEPCGASSSPYKEVLLCLTDGSLLADFSKTMGGDDTRLSFIPNDSYEDTDESGCNFSVTTNSHGDSVVTWASGHNKYAAWDAGFVTCEGQ